MKNSMKFKIFSMLTVLLIVLAGCSGGSDSGSDSDSDSSDDSGDNSITLSYATTMDDSGIDKDIREFFEEKISELSDDEITIDFYMGGQLGGEKEVLEQMKQGEVDLGYNVLQAELYYPEYNAISIPFLFPDFDSMRDFMASPEIKDEVDKIAREQGGIIPMGMHGYGARWTTSNKPFSNVDELKGLKIRMPEIEWWVDVWDELGALPTPIAATEIVTALQTGTVDAQENFLTNIAGRQMWEFQDYLIKTEHIQFYQTWLVSEDTWENKLNSDQQEMLSQTIEETIAYVDEIVEESNEEFIEEIEDSGMEIIEPDRDELVEKAQPAIDKIIEEDLAPGVYDEVLKAIE